MSKNTKVQIDQATLDFFAAEALQIHALCDRSNVPREVNGTAMSMAQRVAILEGVCQGLVSRLGMDPLHTLH